MIGRQNDSTQAERRRVGGHVMRCQGQAVHPANGAGDASEPVRPTSSPWCPSMSSARPSPAQSTVLEADVRVCPCPRRLLTLGRRRSPSPGTSPSAMRSTPACTACRWPTAAPRASTRASSTSSARMAAPTTATRPVVRPPRLAFPSPSPPPVRRAGSPCRLTKARARGHTHSLPLPQRPDGERAAGPAARDCQSPVPRAQLLRAADGPGQDPRHWHRHGQVGD